MSLGMIMQRYFYSLFCFLSCSLQATAADSPTNNVAELIRDHTEFATSLYAAIDSPSNEVISPYSIATSLAMVFLGARNETADEIQKTLHLDLDRDQLASATLALAGQLQSKEGSAYQLKVANAIWVDQDTFILANYRHTLESAFKAKIDRINFQKPEQAATTINQWVSDQTKGKIANLFLPTDLDEFTRLVLTNAVYFQGSFISPFNEKQTENLPFHPTPGTTSSVSMMQQTGSFPYFENNLFQMLCLPFASNNEASLALIILLPRSADNLSQMESDLNYSWVDWLSALQRRPISIQLPRFSIKKRIDLNATLQKMGMKIPFSPEANFSAINGTLDLYLSKVIHETFFALDEAGVVAAAATGASVGVKSVSPTTPIPFIADHPFLFLVADMVSHEILLMGKFQEPKDTL